MIWFTAALRLLHTKIACATANQEFYNLFRKVEPKNYITSLSIIPLLILSVVCPAQEKQRFPHRQNIGFPSSNYPDNL
jgi:hypothetical protein